MMATKYTRALGAPACRFGANEAVAFEVSDTGAVCLSPPGLALVARCTSPLLPLTSSTVRWKNPPTTTKQRPPPLARDRPR